MQLDEFYNYKNQFMDDILTTESIVKLIDDTKTLDTAPSLLFENVFPYEYTPDTVEDGRTLVYVDVDIQKDYTKTYLMPILLVWVLSHKSSLRLPNGNGVRTDKLCSEICKKINGSRKYGLGELEIYSVKRFAPATDYQGKVMLFIAKEFNRPHDPRKVIPPNRRG